ncbi:MAG: alkaline phosphatase family protein [Planctomycetes bacterium]|nr:alkaline phosphatase family protein [Planctomycetota bacterium]
MERPRLMVIGLDSIGLKLLESFRGRCPAIWRLASRGAAGSAIPCFPIYTPTNWAVLSTGADSSTTAAEGWHNTVSGSNLSTFDRRSIPCDTIFDSAARGGLRTLAVSYPTGFPVRSKLNMALAPLDRGLVSNNLVPGKILEVKPGAGGAFSFVLVKAPEAISGAAMAKAVGATEDGEATAGKGRTATMQDIEASLRRRDAGWELRLLAGRGSRYALRHEQWSRPIPVRVPLPGRPGKCLVRVMVFGRGRRLAVSECYDVGNLGSPETLVKRILAKLGPPTEHSVFYSAMTRLFSKGASDLAIERLARKELQAQAKWIADAAAMTFKESPYDIFYLHHHYPDSVLHAYLAAAEGARSFSPRQHAMARKAIATAIGICDGLVKGLLKLAGPKTTVLVVSDHGNVPNRYGTNVSRRLADCGLTVLDKAGKVDRKKSLAWRSDRVGTWVEINARPGTPAYEDAQAKVLDCLLDWKTPDGRRVIALALRKKDSHLLDYHGPDCGDVTFHYNSGFSWFGSPKKALQPNDSGANHGPQMPVTISKLSDNMSFFVAAGPRIKRGLRWDWARRGHIRLVDVVPTVCEASGVPPPANVTGAIRRELLR